MAEAAGQLLLSIVPLLQARDPEERAGIAEEAERAARLAKKLFAPDPAFKPARIATISKDEARFWADGIYDVYRPPRSDTMRPDPPPPPVTIPPPREDAA